MKRIRVKCYLCTMDHLLGCIICPLCRCQIARPFIAARLIFIGLVNMGQCKIVFIPLNGCNEPVASKITVNLITEFPSETISFVHQLLNVIIYLARPTAPSWNTEVSIWKETQVIYFHFHKYFLFVRRFIAA